MVSGGLKALKPGKGGERERGMEGTVSICMYSGAPLLWTPWGPGKVSCIERCPHLRGKFLFRKHIWDIASVFNTEVSIFQGCPLRGHSNCSDSAGKSRVSIIDPLPLRCNGGIK